MESKIPLYIAVQLEAGFDKDRRRIWLPLPATKKQFETAKKAIDNHCSGVILHRFVCKVPCVGQFIGKSPLSKINHLASRLKTLDYEQVLKICAISESNLLFDTVEEMIEFTYNTKKYTLSPDYFNMEAVWSDASDKSGEFTSLGYLMREAGYDGKPKDRRVPASLDLRGGFGEELYEELETDCV